MKKLFSMPVLVFLAVLAIFSAVSFAGAGSNWFQSIDSEFVDTRDLRASGNVVVNGSFLKSPDLTYTSLSNTTTLNPYGKSNLVINGTGAIVMASVPTISTLAALSGQEILIMGGANAVTFVDEGGLTGSLLELDSSSRAISTGDTLRLMYYGGKWYETGFTDN